MLLRQNLQVVGLTSAKSSRIQATFCCTEKRERQLNVFRCRVIEGMSVNMLREFHHVSASPDLNKISRHVIANRTWTTQGVRTSSSFEVVSVWVYLTPFHQSLSHMPCFKVIVSLVSYSTATVLNKCIFVTWSPARKKKILDDKNCRSILTDCNPLCERLWIRVIVLMYIVEPTAGKMQCSYYCATTFETGDLWPW